MQDLAEAVEIVPAKIARKRLGEGIADRIGMAKTLALNDLDRRMAPRLLRYDEFHRRPSRRRLPRFATTSFASQAASSGQPSAPIRGTKRTGWMLSTVSLPSLPRTIRTNAWPQAGSA